MEGTKDGREEVQTPLMRPSAFLSDGAQLREAESQYVLTQLLECSSTSNLNYQSDATNSSAQQTSGPIDSAFLTASHTAAPSLVASKVSGDSSVSVLLSLLVAAAFSMLLTALLPLCYNR